MASATYMSGPSGMIQSLSKTQLRKKKAMVEEEVARRLGTFITHEP